MQVTDVLTGEKSVIVETTGDDYKFKKIDDGSVDADSDEVPDEVIDALLDHGIDIPQYPTTIKHYIHDEGNRADYTEISEELGLDEDHELVRRIANLGYEVEFTIDVQSESNAVITHVDGHELVEPKGIY